MMHGYENTRKKEIKGSRVALTSKRSQLNAGIPRAALEEKLECTEEQWQVNTRN
jgi:hypothetical protein